MNRKVVISLLLSFVVALSATGAGDVFQQLGISKADAPKELVWSLGAGQVAVSEVRSTLKAASPAVRAAIVEQVLVWAKAFVSSPQFAKTWAAHREEYKPSRPEADQPDAMPYYQEELKSWNEQYPADGKALVKQRLREFLEATANVDYSAKLVAKGGKMRFANQAYEEKPGEWKLAYRAGREPSEKARAFVKAWLAELK